jgi:hypothetical protein
MNWEAIGAIGEGLGAIGVIVTVIYVALQIRQNSAAVCGATEQNLMSQEMTLYALFAEHANVYRRGRAGLDNLDADELERFTWLVAAAQSQLYSAFVQYQRGLIPESVWAAYHGDWVDYVNQPGYYAIWQDMRHIYPREFGEALDAIAMPKNPSVK